MKAKRTTPPRPTTPSPTRTQGTRLFNDREILIHKLLREQFDQPSTDGRVVTAPELAILCEVSEKTIYRDLDFMRDRRHLPISTKRGKNGGVRYTEAVTEFPGLKFSAGELTLLVLGLQALSIHRGTAKEKESRATLEKLFRIIDDRMAEDLKRLETLITFKPGGFEAPVDPEVFEACCQALFNQEELTFTHTKPDPDAQPMERHVQPRHLASIASAWYLYTDDLVREGERHFALSRVTDVKSTGKKFIPKKPFDLDQRMGGSMGAHRGGEKHGIRLRFAREVRQLVLERNWHEDQRLECLSDGRVEMTMEALVNPELMRFIRSWGPEVEVVEPAELRAAVAEEATRTAAQYRA